jgi:hypothetical protein
MNRSRLGLLFAASRSIEIKDIQGKAKEMQRTTNEMDLQCLSPVDTRQLQYQPHNVRRAVPVLERVEQLAAYIMLYMLIHPSSNPPLLCPGGAPTLASTVLSSRHVAKHATATVPTHRVTALRGGRRNHDVKALLARRVGGAWTAAPWRHFERLRCAGAWLDPRQG